MARKFFPKKKRAAKKTFKRKFKSKRKIFSRSTITRARSITMPDRQMVKLRWQSLVTYSGGAAFSNTFRGNGMQDPDFTGAATQPVGYDQYAALYRNYRVFGSKITVSFIPDEASTQPYIVTLYPALDTSVEAPVLSGQYAYAKNITVLAQNPQTKYFKSWMSTDKIYGFAKGYVKFDNELAAAISTNPAKEWYWQVSGLSSDGSTNIAGFYRVTITYYAEFFGRQDLAQS